MQLKHRNFLLPENTTGLSENLSESQLTPSKIHFCLLPKL